MESSRGRPLIFQIPFCSFFFFFFFPSVNLSPAISTRSGNDTHVHCCHLQNEWGGRSWPPPSSSEHALLGRALSHHAAAPCRGKRVAFLLLMLALSLEHQESTGKHLSWRNSPLYTQKVERNTGAASPGWYFGVLSPHFSIPHQHHCGTSYHSGGHLQCDF